MITPEIQKRFDDILVCLALHEKYNFYAHVLFAMNVRLDESVGTACIGYVGGKFYIKVSPKFMFEVLPDEKTEIQRITLLVHEILHALYLHPFRVETRDREIWNVAGDLVINQHLFSRLDADAKLATIGLNIGTDPFQFPPNLTTEQYYDLLIESGYKPDPRNGDGEPGDSLESDIDQSSCQISEVEKEMIKDELQRIATRAKQKSPNCTLDEVNAVMDFLNSQHKIDWKNELIGVTGNRRCMKEPTFKRRDRRQSHRLDLLGKRVRTGFTVGCLCDESGSMSPMEIMSGLVEVKGVCETTSSDMWVVHCDTTATEPEPFDMYATTFARRKHGGTYLYPGWESFKDSDVEIDALIVITDGDIEERWPEVLDIPVFFLTMGDKLNFDISVSPKYKHFDISKDITK